MNIQYHKDNSERGFTLVSSLIILMLMTVMIITVSISTTSIQRASASSKAATIGYYYAETGGNYLSWALRNDAEFDSYKYPHPVDTVSGTKRLFSEPVNRPGLLTEAVGDLSEWGANLGNPNGDTFISEAFITPDNNDVAGQIMYFDSELLKDRVISWPHAKDFPPTLYNIHTNLPRYIKLEIDENGIITPQITPYNPLTPHHGSVVGVDIPFNGAIVWVTAGVIDHDLQLSAIDLYAAPMIDSNSNVVDLNVGSGYLRPDWLRDNNGSLIMNEPLKHAGRDFQDPMIPLYAGLPCDPATFQPEYVACGAKETVSSPLLSPLVTDNYQWLTTATYGLVVYSIGYVQGEPRNIIRTVVKL